MSQIAPRPVCLIALLCLMSALSTCQSKPLPGSSNANTGAAGEDSSSFADRLAKLSRLSCPDGQPYLTETPIDISAEAVTPGSPEILDASPPGTIALSKAWHLTSSHAGFGGLSGLEVLANGDLLAVSDDGAFIRIDMDEGRPSGTGHLSYMLDENGQMLSGKASGDAEGLSVLDGIALVSFERDHRILAFNLEVCGAAARGARVTALPDTIEGHMVKPNRGAEALAYSVREDRLIVHYEDSAHGDTKTALIAPSGTIVTQQSPIGYNGYSSVGADLERIAHATDLKTYLFRSYDPVRGNRNMLDVAIETETGGTRASYMVKLGRPFLTDNFEGVAGQRLNNGDFRVWIISDNNFSDRQRTLLYAFDISRRTAPQIAGPLPQ